MSRLVLVVEDNPANLLLVKAVLQRGGYEVQSAGNAVEARARLAGSDPMVVLMDLQLPGEDGLSLTRSLRQEPRLAELPIIALTSNAMQTDQDQAMAAGCTGYMSKPINTRTFVEELEGILGRLPAAS